MTKDSGLLDNVNDGGTTISANGIGDINIQHMTGVDKNIENYEQMVGNFLLGNDKRLKRWPHILVEYPL